jgi:putative heme-binding domain-containing protein
MKDRRRVSFFASGRQTTPDVGFSALVAAAAVAVALLAGGGVSAQRGLTDIPSPDAALELAALRPADGFAINLIASEPAISKPIHMNFDAAGRLWVVGSAMYPHIQPGQPRRDRIYVLEDTDGDGRADRSTVFADHLLIPTGIAPDDTAPHLAAYVANSSELLYLEDTTGDGVADKTTVVLSGFGTEDTHHLIHSFRFGPGGHLFFAQSIYIHSHVETPWGVRRLLGGGVWRFDPRSLELDVFTRGGINMWGLHVDRYGQFFLTDGANAQGITYAFPGAPYETAVGATRILKGLNPGQPKQSGLEVISGRHLPEAWQGRLVTNDFRGHRVNSFRLEDSGSGYVSRQAEDLITSAHAAFRPVDVKMGPDGAIYVADWYNPIIQHGEVDFRDPRRDTSHGRIWRVTARGRPLVTPPDLTRATVSELLELLRAPEQYTRERVRPVLARRGAAAVAPALGVWAGQLDPADREDAPLLLEALWAYQWLRTPAPDVLVRALQSTDVGVRAGAVRVASDWAGRLGNAMTIFTAAAADPHPRVRLEAVNALRLAGTAEAARAAIAVTDRPLDVNLDFALWLTLRELADEWLPRAQADPSFFGPDPARLILAIRSAGRGGALGPLLRQWRAGAIPAALRQPALDVMAELGGPAELGVLFDLVTAEATPAADRASLLGALARAARDRSVRPAGPLAAFAPLLDATDEGVRAAAVTLAGAWRFEDARGAIIRAARSDAPSLRRAALDALAALGRESRPLLLELATTGVRPRRIDAVAALARLDSAAAAPIAAGLLASPPSPEDAGALASPFLSLKDGPAALGKALAGRSLSAATGREVLRAIATSGRELPDLVRAVEAAAKLDRLAAMPTGDALRAMIAAVEAEGDAARGEEVYRRAALACTSCHAIGGAGGQVGPDLGSLGGSAQVDYILEALLDPQARVKEGYHLVTITRRDGTVVSGVLAAEAAGEISLRDGADRLVTIPAVQIAGRGVAETSLMPPGLTASLRRDEVLDLVRFLAALGREPAFTVPRAPVVRHWRILEADRDVSARLREHGMGYAARPGADLPWRPGYSTVAGDLPLAGIPIVSYFGDQRFRVVQFEIDAPQQGVSTLRLPAPAGLSVWLGERAMPVSGPDLALDLPAGRHLVTVVVENNGFPGTALRLELAAGQAQIVAPQSRPGAAAR